MNGWGKKLTEQFVPFDRDGNQKSYDYIEYNEWCAAQRGEKLARNWTEVTYLPNEEFVDTLTFVGYGRGRSSVTFEFARQSTGKMVTMFAKDFTDAVPYMVRGQVRGTFTFCKRGANYGTRLVKEEV